MITSPAKAGVGVAVNVGVGVGVLVDVGVASPPGVQVGVAVGVLVGVGVNVLVASAVLVGVLVGVGVGVTPDADSMYRDGQVKVLLFWLTKYQLDAQKPDGFGVHAGTSLMLSTLSTPASSRFVTSNDTVFWLLVIGTGVPQVPTSPTP